MISIFTAVILLIMPAVIIYWAIKAPILNKIGVITLNFAIGIFVAILLTFAVENQLITTVNIDAIKEVQTNFIDVSIALGLSILLFSFNIRESIALAKQLLLPMLLGVVAIITMVLVSVVLLRGGLENINLYAGLATGTYIGGSVNMAAISSAINSGEAIFILMNSYDMIFSGFYILFILTIALPLATKVLSPVVAVANDADSLNCESLNANTGHSSQFIDKAHDKLLTASTENADQYKTLIKIENIKEIFICIAIALLIIMISLQISTFFPKSSAATITIILISILSLAASLIDYINKISISYRLGMYFIIMFCFTVGSMFQISILSSLNIVLSIFLTMLIFGGFILHLLLCKIFKIDVDRFMLSNVSCILSLPFIPLICNRLGKRSLLVAGLAISILGYIIGIFLGIAVAYLL